MIFLLFDSVYWFYLFLFILACVDVFALESDQGWIASVAFVFFFVFVFIWGDVSPFLTWLTSSYTIFFGSLVGYVAMSVTWGGIIEWKLYLRRMTLKIKEDRKSWLKKQGVKEVTLKTLVPEELKEDWAKHNMHKDHDWKYLNRNKGKVISTMTWWPMAMVRTLFREPFLFLYDLIGGWLQSMSDRAAKDADVLD